MFARGYHGGSWLKPDLSYGQIRLDIPQTDRKRDADTPAREAPIPIKIAQNDLGGVLVGDRQFRHFLLKGECHGGLARKCVRSSDCGLRALWRAVQGALRDTLARIHLADLQRDERAMTAWLDPIRLVPLSRASEHAILSEDSR